MLADVPGRLGWTTFEECNPHHPRRLLQATYAVDHTAVSASAPPSCSRCEAVLMPVVYGYPTAEVIAASRRGEIAIGGCPEDDVTFACTTHPRRSEKRH